MSTKPSKIWAFALPVSLLILASAYYIKVPSARQFIDAHTSLGRQWLGRFVPEPEVIEIPARKPSKDSAPEIAAYPGPGASPEPSQSAQPQQMDLPTLATKPELWPKKIVLKKAITFPAVVNGKVVGNLIAPMGAEANLKIIKDGKLGVEYQGGGAWLAVEDTDLASRVPLR
jgi:hypothetical protein